MFLEGPFALKKTPLRGLSLDQLAKTKLQKENKNFRLGGCLK